MSDERSLLGEDFVAITKVEIQFEADFIKDALEKEGIPVLVRNFQDTAYNGIFIPQKGWAEIKVPTSQKENAKRIIRIVKESFKK